MSDSHKKHMPPDERAARRAGRARQRSLKSPKQVRVNERAALRKEYR